MRWFRVCHLHASWSYGTSQKLVYSQLMVFHPELCGRIHYIPSKWLNHGKLKQPLKGAKDCSVDGIYFNDNGFLTTSSFRDTPTWLELHWQGKRRCIHKYCHSLFQGRLQITQQYTTFPHRRRTVKAASRVLQACTCSMLTFFACTDKHWTPSNHPWPEHTLPSTHRLGGTCESCHYIFVFLYTKRWKLPTSHLGYWSCQRRSSSVDMWKNLSTSIRDDIQQMHFHLSQGCGILSASRPDGLALGASAFAKADLGETGAALGAFGLGTGTLSALVLGLAVALALGLAALLVAFGVALGGLSEEGGKAGVCLPRGLGGVLTAAVAAVGLLMARSTDKGSPKRTVSWVSKTRN